MRRERFTVCPDYDYKCFETDGLVFNSPEEYKKFKEKQLRGLCIEYLDETSDNFNIYNIVCDEQQDFGNNIFIKVYK